MKTRSSFYNSVASLAYYIITLLLGIVNRKFVISIMGIEYQGINGLFSNVLSMLSIAELGIGMAIVYHLYRPISENCIEEIKMLMAFYKKCYLTIAITICMIGLTLMPALPLIVKDNTTEYSLQVLYIWFLLDAIVSYLFTYKRSILIADQKNYIVIVCDILCQLISKLGQILILWITNNFIFYLVIMVLCRLLENLLINGISNKKYPFLMEKNVKTLNPIVLSDIKQKVKGTFFHKIGGFIVLGTDNILISKFLGLAVLGTYSNYYLIINSIKSICSNIICATTASVGLMLAEGDDKKNYRVFEELQILNLLLINCGATGIYCVASPLIAVIFGEKYIISEFTLFILSFNFCIYGMRTVYTIFKETAGILYEDRYIPILESLINISASVYYLKKYGLAGVFIGTIISSIVLFVYTYPVLVYRGVLKRPVWEYYRELIWMMAVIIVSLLSSKAICNFIVIEKGFLQITVYSAIALVVSNILYFILYMAWKIEAKSLVKKMKRLVIGR